MWLKIKDKVTDKQNVKTVLQRSDFKVPAGEEISLK